jgi:hypothetical protein
MTLVVWCALGMCLSAGLIHGALALRRPVKRQYLVFAILMGLASIYYYLDVRVYRASSLEAAIASNRTLASVGLLLLACFAWFVREYTQVRFGRVITGAFWAGLLGSALYNAISTRGVFIGAEPQLVTVRWLGKDVQIVTSQFGIAEVVYFTFVAAVFAVAMSGGVRMYRRGDRRGGSVFVVGTGLLLAAVFADLSHEVLGGQWPYMSEFSFALMSVIMAIQLAIEFRTTDKKLAATLLRIEVDTAALSHALDKSLAIRDVLNTPLQTLSLQLAMLDARSPREAELLAKLQRDIDELAGLGHSIMPVPNGGGEHTR